MAKSKIVLSGLEFRVLSREIALALDGTYVSNLYSIGESQLLRTRRPAVEEGGEPVEVSLVLSPKLGAWVTQQPARVETTEFTTSLRSHLLRAKFEGVSQPDLDRVLVLRFEGRGGPLSLVLEMLPPGNLVLTGPDGKVLLALHEVRTDARRISKGRTYLPPPQSRASLETLTRQDLKGALAKEKTLGSALGRGLSIPRRYVDEILARVSHAQGDSTDVSEAEVGRIEATVNEIVESLVRPWPCFVKAEGGGVEVMVVEPKRMEVVEASPRLSPLLDKLLIPDLLEEAEKGGASTGGIEVDPHQRRIMEYKATIAGLESKKVGLAKLSLELRELARSVRAAPDAGEALAMAKASKSLPADLVPGLDTAGLKGQASISSAIFDRAKKAEREVEDLDSAIIGLGSKLKRESGRVETVREKAISLSKTKREWFEKFRWFFTTGGKLAIGGRDAQSNSALIRRHMEAGDTVYHADLFGSPFFILKGGSGQTGEETREVAKATVAFSSAWKTGLGAADAYWVSPGQVGTAGPSGEYLAHGSFAIRGKKNFVAKNPVEIAVGIDQKGRIVAGPEESIMRVAKAHVVVAPSKDKASDTAKKVLNELRPHAASPSEVGVDEVLRALPAGGGRIVRKRVDRLPP